MNLANKITLARIILVPVFLAILSIKIKYGHFLAAGVFILAASTDGLDGYFARKRNQVTKLGKFMDPLADKLLVSAALLSLVELGRISAWIAFVIIGREFAVTGLRAIAAADGVVISASKLGKLKTVTQIVAIAILMLDNFPFTFLNLPVDQIAVWLAVIITIVSGVDYFYKNRSIIKKSK